MFPGPGPHGFAWRGIDTPLSPPPPPPLEKPPANKTFFQRFFQGGRRVGSGKILDIGEKARRLVPRGMHFRGFLGPARQGGLLPKRKGEMRRRVSLFAGPGESFGGDAWGFKIRNQPGGGRFFPGGQADFGFLKPPLWPPRGGVADGPGVFFSVVWGRKRAGEFFPQPGFLRPRGFIPAKMGGPQPILATKRGPPRGRISWRPL